MSVRFAPEVPNHLGTLDLPNVPDFVVPDVLVFVIGEMKFVDVVGFDQLEGFVRILLAKRAGDRQNFGQQVLLITAQIRGGQSVEILGGAFCFDGLVSTFSTASLCE